MGIGALFKCYRRTIILKIVIFLWVWLCFSIYAPMLIFYIAWKNGMSLELAVAASVSYLSITTLILLWLNYRWEVRCKKGLVELMSNYTARVEVISCLVKLLFLNRKR